ncbi:MAG: hypothetical protein U9N61_10425 [Euryarchaeota archaeon]|nr:hypothetical protein [Euryarchaeota archaeon]
MTTHIISGYYLKHDERGILSKLTEYADHRDVIVKDGRFKATLNPALSTTSVDDLKWILEHTLHAMWG